MSDQTPQTQVPPVIAEASLPERNISPFVKISIVMLALLSLAAISLLFIGDFEGKVERIVATFVIFAVFAGLTAFDTRLGQANTWYAPVALIANSYILALLLIITWMSAGGFFLGWNIFWKSFVVVLVTRAVVGCCQLFLGLGKDKPAPLAVSAFITSVLATITGILFTAPLAIEVFNMTVTELYWRVSVAALMLTGLGLSITLLLRWNYLGEARAHKKAASAAKKAAQAYPAASHIMAPPLAPGVPAGQPVPVAQTAPAVTSVPVVLPPSADLPAPNPELSSVGTAQTEQPVPALLVAADQVVTAEPAGEPAVAVHPVLVAETVTVTEAATVTDSVTVTEAVTVTDSVQAAEPVRVAEPTLPAEPELLPWPTFADGTPFPIGPDGQPDFSVLDNR